MGNLEFRAASAFGTTGSAAPDLLVATMTNNGNTIFGNPAVAGTAAKVSVENTGQIGLNVISSVTPQFTSTGVAVSQVSGTDQNMGLEVITGTAISNTGVVIKNGPGNFNIGLLSNTFADEDAIAVLGRTPGEAAFEAAIYGETPANNGNQFAAYFDGQTFSTTGWGPSDAKLKENVKQEENVLERLSKLTAVTYNFKNMTELNLPKSVQHGFVAQELAQVFPELTQDIAKPVFDKEGKLVSTFEFKSVNYTGLISVLTAAVNELNSEVKLLKEEVEELRNGTDSSRNSGNVGNKVILEQNIPNPFSDRTTIKYQLPEDVTKASLIIFDMNGGVKKDFPLTQNKGEINVTASQIGKGLFIYSLVQNGQILETKKMIIQ